MPPPFIFALKKQANSTRREKPSVLDLSASPLQLSPMALPEALAIYTFPLLNFYATFCLPIGPTSHHFCKLKLFSLFCQKYGIV
jgi:hypothetical protein